MNYPEIHSTTVLGIVRDGVAVIGGDGQVTLGNTVVKRSTVKVRKLANNTVLAGFAGGAADAFALLEHFEGKLEETRGNLPRAALSLARDWRTDKFLRRLEAFHTAHADERPAALARLQDAALCSRLPALP